MQVALSWNAAVVPAGVTVTYNVYRNGGPSGYQLIFTNLTANAYTDGPNDLDNATTYTYTVTAVTSDGESLPSIPVTAVPVGPLSAPTGLTAVIS
jgi:fibronectin type 3 domain-containing protein